jgi:hypothetical protein
LGGLSGIAQPGSQALNASLSGGLPQGVSSLSSPLMQAPVSGALNSALAPTVGNAGSLAAPALGAGGGAAPGLTMPTLGQVGTGLQVAGQGADMLAPKPPQGGPIRPAPVMAARNQIPYTKPAPRGMGRFGGM